MIIEIVNKKNNRIGSLKIVDENCDLITKDVHGKIDVDDNFNDVDDIDDRKLQITLEASPFESLNHASCVSPLEQELSAYEALKESYLKGEYSNCCTLIKYYFGHVDYGEQFGYYKTHGQIGFILFSNLLFSIEAGNDDFIDFVNRMIHKINRKLERKS